MIAKITSLYNLTRYAVRFTEQLSGLFIFMNVTVYVFSNKMGNFVTKKCFKVYI